MPGSPPPLNKRLEVCGLVEAYDKPTGTHVQAFFQDISGDDKVFLARLELSEGISLRCARQHIAKVLPPLAAA